MEETQIVKMLNVFESNLEWFNQNLVNLKEKYDQNYVAIEDSKVIAFDNNINSLVNKLKQLGKDPSKTFIQFVSKIKSIF